MEGFLIFRFVRFLTLDEAQDAVREKHLKMIGNKQIQVELSAGTRQKLQDNDIDEGAVGSKFLLLPFSKPGLYARDGKV